MRGVMAVWELILGLPCHSVGCCGMRVTWARVADARGRARRDAWFLFILLPHSFAAVFDAMGC